MEAYLDEDTNDVTIACINTYVAEVNKVVAASGNKDAYITLSDTTNEGRMPAKFSPSDEFETEGLRATTSCSSPTPTPTRRSSPW